MSEIIRTSFYYSPIRQGYDTNSWRTLSGAPAIVAGGRISVDNGQDAGSAIHYADILKGEISFNVNVPVAPGGASASRQFGVFAPNTNDFVGFTIGATLNCVTTNGSTTTTSDEIQWNALWTGENIVFKIRWEAGGAKFFINDTQVYGVSDDSVPYGPLSLYLADSSATPMTIGDINVRGTFSFVMNPKTSDTSSFSGLMSMSQTVTITESVSLTIIDPD